MSQVQQTDTCTLIMLLKYSVGNTSYLYCPLQSLILSLIGLIGSIWSTNKAISISVSASWEQASLKLETNSFQLGTAYLSLPCK